MKFSSLIKDLENSSHEGIYPKDKIEHWLHKYQKDYQIHNEGIGNRPSMPVTYRKDVNFNVKKRIDFINKTIPFLDTYEALLEVLECYNNEYYYKAEMELYTVIKSDKLKLKSWLELHKLDKGKKLSKFKQLFQNTSTLSGYELVIRYPFSLPVKIKLDEADFKETLQFLKLLERSEKTQFIGTINTINDLEFFEKKVTKTDKGESHRRTFTKRSMTITLNNTEKNELLVNFIDKRIQQIENLKTGQKVKLYADLIDGKNELDKFKYPLNLLGWDIEVIKKLNNGSNRENKNHK